MAEVIYPSVSPQEFARRYDAVWREMERHGIGVLVVYGDSSNHGGNLANIAYLTGYRDPHFSYAVLPLGCEPRLLISNPLYLPTAYAMACVESVESLSWDPGASLSTALADAGCSDGRIGLVGVRGIQRANLPYEHVRAMREALPAADWVDGTDLLQQVRRIKSAEEIELLRVGAQLTDATVQALQQQARPGMTEHELAGIVYRAGSAGCGEARTTFIGATQMVSPDIVFPRQLPSQRAIRGGDIVLTELSTGYAGYAGQIHRPLVLGEPTPEYRRLFDVARETFDQALSALGPGRTDQDLRAAVAPVLKSAGVWTMDTLLHGWGLTLEAPRLDVVEVATIARPQQPVVFEPGMTLVLQPHVLSSDRTRGLQLGSLVVIDEAGATALQQYPMDWIRIAA